MTAARLILGLIFIDMLAAGSRMVSPRLGISRQFVGITDIELLSFLVLRPGLVLSYMYNHYGSKQGWFGWALLAASSQFIRFTWPVHGLGKISYFF